MQHAAELRYASEVLQREDIPTGRHKPSRWLRKQGPLTVPPSSNQYSELKRSYHGATRRAITIDEEYDSDPIVFDRKISELHNTAVDAGSDVRPILEPGSDDPDEYDDDPLDSNQPELMAQVPRTLRFWAVAN